MSTPVRVTDLPDTPGPQPGDYLLLDGPSGTRKALVDTLIINSLRICPTPAYVQANLVPQDAILLVADSQPQPEGGLFIKGGADADPHDGVNKLIDLGNNHFRRLRLS